MEIVLNDVLHIIRGFIGAIGVVIITFGALRGMYQFIMSLASHAFDYDHIRLQLGDSIILGLEFIVGADIIGSLVSPNYYNLGLLAIIVVIRVTLSFFLSNELRELSPARRKTIK